MDILNERQRELIKAISKKFENQEYINGDFLVENEVRSDELNIFNTVDAILKGFLGLDIYEQQRIILVGVGLPMEIITFMIAEQKAKDAVNTIS